jgi:uncharacterized membrane protein
MQGNGNDHLPERNGFRLRGAEMSRLETFADAAFAFALTLIVISFDEIPSSYHELATAMRGMPAFAASFALVVMFWIGHRNWSQRFGLDDTVSTLLSCALVFVIMVYVYPLRVLMSAAFSQLTGGWAPANFSLESLDQVRYLFVIYGSGFAAANFCLAGLNRHAGRRADDLELNQRERRITRFETRSWFIVGSFGLVSIVLAITLPGPLVGLAGWVYFGLALIMPLRGHLSARGGSGESPDRAPRPRRGFPHLVAARYASRYPDPVRFRYGDRVTLGEGDPAFPGWVGVTDTGGRTGWAPESALERRDESSAIATEDYDATELDVGVGDAVAIHRELAGWYRVSTPDGRRGWIPASALDGP